MTSGKEYMNKVRILRELENIKKNQNDVKNIITENLKYMIRNQGFPDD